MKFLNHSSNLINLAQAICIYKFTATGAKAQYRIRFDFPARPKKEEFYQIAFETEVEQTQFFDWLMFVIGAEIEGVFDEVLFNNWRKGINGTQESTKN